MDEQVETSSGHQKTESVDTVRSLFMRVEPEEVVRAVCRVYDEGMDNEYRDAITGILKLDPQPTTMCCALGDDSEIRNLPSSVSVYGKELGNDQQWALTCTSWKEWLSMPVLIEETLKGLSETEVAAHILYEMTWGGWSEDEVTDKREMLGDRMDEVLEAIDSGDASKFVTLQLPKPN